MYRGYGLEILSCHLLRCQKRARTMVMLAPQHFAHLQAIRCGFRARRRRETFFNIGGCRRDSISQRNCRQFRALGSMKNDRCSKASVLKCPLKFFFRWSRRWEGRCCRPNRGGSRQHPKMTPHSHPGSYTRSREGSIDDNVLESKVLKLEFRPKIDILEFLHSKS
jgi:hypothetical protein